MLTSYRPIMFDAAEKSIFLLYYKYAWCVGLTCTEVRLGKSKIFDFGPVQRFVVWYRVEALAWGILVLDWVDKSRHEHDVIKK